MIKRALKGNVILPDRILIKGIVLVEGKRISGVYSQKDKFSDKEADLYDFADNFISPGLIDMHIHGALGKDVMDCEIESLKKIAFHLSKCGVTGFMSTTASSSLRSLLEAVETIQRTEKSQLPSEPLGIYVEGPFLNIKRKGAQDPSFIRGMNEDEIHHIIKAVKGLKTIISMAPEVNDNMNFINTLKENGMTVAIGHSDATYQQAIESFEKGITHATHLFNAMSGYHHREPGVVGAVFDSPEVTAEIIADGIHLHPSALRLVFSRKGTDKICLITDSIKAAGMGDGILSMGNLKIEVKGNEARLAESNVLAGSVLTLNRAVKNALEWIGVPVNQAVNMASLNPARVLGLDKEMGSIQDGKYANLAIFDRHFNVVETVLKGKSVFVSK
jgi:N-acetylglucosamine-6-phosphate deacetylase